jgi:nucleoside-triphosphatase THEP1
MKFNEYNFNIVNSYLSFIADNEINGRIIIDEVGWLELKGKGIYLGISKLINSKSIKELYLSVRFDSYKQIIEKFNINDYELVILG